MIETAIIAIIGIMLFVVTITDLRTREVSDYLTLGATVLGLTLRFAWSVIYREWSPLLMGVIGCVILGIFGYALYKWDVWGKGDANLLVALGALIGYSNEFWFILCCVSVWYVAVIMCFKYIAEKWFNKHVGEMAFVPPIALSTVLFIIINQGIIH